MFIFIIIVYSNPIHFVKSLAVFSDYGLFLDVTKQKYSEANKFGKQFVQQNYVNCLKKWRTGNFLFAVVHWESPR